MGTVVDEPELSINRNEVWLLFLKCDASDAQVAKVEWIPLELFLKNDRHWNCMYENYDVAHGFNVSRVELYFLSIYEIETKYLFSSFLNCKFPDLVSGLLICVF